MSKLKFIDFKKAIHKQFNTMIKGKLFVTDVDKEVLWDTYLDSYPEGTNKMFRERREYDCQHCKQFIRGAGSVVSIKNGRLVSIWDIKIGGVYQIVADALSKLIKSKNIEDEFLYFEENIGVDYNTQITDSGNIRWNHFYFQLPNEFVNRYPGTKLNETRTRKELLKSSLTKLSLESADIVIDLINQKSIYRGVEHKKAVLDFIKTKKEFDKLSIKKQDLFCWTSDKFGIKNTVIGSLLEDITKEKDLDAAVTSFEKKVAPANYKRTNGVITKRMIETSQKKFEELGIIDSTHRRFATPEDVTINNVLFANRDSKKIMNIFDEMVNEIPDKVKNLDKVENVSIDDFVNKIIPNAKKIEIMVENTHMNNLMSLIAPIYPDSSPILKWNNNFSWSYKGEVTDSIKENVKKAGGNVNGVLRYSIQWNDNNDNKNDFDAHCIEPNNNLIYYGNAGRTHLSTGILDVDIISPTSKPAVENITWSDINKIHQGITKFLVHNYNHNGGKSGFTAEIEYNGKIHTFVYNKELRTNEKVLVAEIDFDKNSKDLKFIKSLPTTKVTKEIWGISTCKFQNVSMMMHSPNFWDEQEIGNKHYFFILEKCLNDEPARGFYNEFLKEELRQHRKVFEVLSSKMKTEKSNNQLSGLGFSSTQRNSIICRVSGKFNRIIKLNF